MKDYIKERVSVELNGCWVWIRSKNSDGYGNANYEGKQWLAHRLSYTAFNGAIPDGMVVMHTCDRPECVSPHHLKLGSLSDNVQDMIAKGRAKLMQRNVYCYKGHHKKGRRVCPECKRIRDAERYKRCPF